MKALFLLSCKQSLLYSVFSKGHGGFFACFLFLIQDVVFKLLLLNGHCFKPPPAHCGILNLAGQWQELLHADSGRFLFGSSCKCYLKRVVEIFLLLPLKEAKIGHTSYFTPPSNQNLN